MKVCQKTGKHCYGSKDHAKRVMRHLAAALRVYRCDSCGQFHFTKKHG
ncbi:MAG: hypothetical protein LC118_06220 [Dehalococcoidia bacterium]|nr:hypothetical protein [Dehalococcoidia bacterium]